MKKKFSVLKIALLSTLLATGVGFAVYQSVAPKKVEAAAAKKAKATKAAKAKSYEERVRERVAKLPSYLSAAERQKLIDQIKAEERNK